MQPSVKTLVTKLQMMKGDEEWVEEADELSEGVVGCLVNGGLWGRMRDVFEDCL